MAEIVSIVYKPQRDNEPKPYTRVPLDEAALVAGYGIEGDVKGGHPKRQLNIMSAETMAQLQSEGFYTEPGQLGEQIVIKGLDVAALAPGERVQLGEAQIEVVALREPCDRFAYAQDKPKETAVGRVGIMARVVKSGQIRVGDPVAVVTVTA